MQILIFWTFLFSSQNSVSRGLWSLLNDEFRISSVKLLLFRNIIKRQNHLWQPWDEMFVYGLCIHVWNMTLKRCMCKKEQKNYLVIFSIFTFTFRFALFNLDCTTFNRMAIQISYSLIGSWFIIHMNKSEIQILFCKMSLKIVCYKNDTLFT